MPKGFCGSRGGVVAPQLCLCDWSGGGETRTEISSLVFLSPTPVLSRDPSLFGKTENNPYFFSKKPWQILAPS